MPFLPEAIASIEQQTWQNWELVVVDDGSTDGSAEWLEQRALQEPRIRVIRQPHAGVTVALNRGLREVRGELIARMDADDIAHPERFARQVAYLQASPQVVAVGSWVRRIDADGDPIAIACWPSTHEEIVEGLVRGMGGLPHPTAMIRRSAMERVGGYREQFRLAQDKDLWLRLAEMGNLANLREVLLDYREHPESISQARRDQQRDHLQAILDDAERRGVLPIPAARSRSVARQRTRPSELEWLRAASRAGNWSTAWKYAGQLLTRYPFQPLTWWSLLRLIADRLLRPARLLFRQAPRKIRQLLAHVRSW